MDRWIDRSLVISCYIIHPQQHFVINVSAFWLDVSPKSTLFSTGKIKKWLLLSTLFKTFKPDFVILGTLEILTETLVISFLFS